MNPSEQKELYWKRSAFGQRKFHLFENNIRCCNSQSIVMSIEQRFSEMQIRHGFGFCRKCVIQYLRKESQTPQCLDELKPPLSQEACVPEREENSETKKSLAEAENRDESLGSKKPDDSFSPHVCRICGKELHSITCPDKIEGCLVLHYEKCNCREEKPKLVEYSHDAETNTTYAYTKSSVDLVLVELERGLRFINENTEELGTKGTSDKLLKYLEELRK